MDMMAFQIMSILFDDTGPALTWYQIDANIHSSFTGKIFILVISTRWLWFPSLCTGYVKLVLVGQPRTPSLRFHLPKVAGLTLRKFPPWCRHAGIPWARRLHSKPWCRPRPALHDSLPGPASVTCQAVRCFLILVREKTEGSAIGQCLPILCTEAVAQVHKSTTPVLTTLPKLDWLYKYLLTTIDHLRQRAYHPEMSKVHPCSFFSCSLIRNQTFKH